MDVGLHGIEAMPGDGRYVITFSAAGGAEQGAIVHVTPDGLDVAPASLPETWQPGSESFALLVDAVRVFDRARRSSAAPAELLDAPGGWDVMIGNVVLDAGSIVTCVSHGAMHLVDDVWTCHECDARALFAPN